MCDCEALDARHLVTDRSSGDVICTACGVVVEGHIIESEWNANERTSPDDPFMPDAHTTVFQRAGGPPVRFRHAAKRQRSDVCLRDAFSNLENKGRDLGFYSTSHVTTQAKELYRDLHAAKSVRGDAAKDACVAAVLYLACKLCGCPRELRHVSTACRCPVSALNDAVATCKDLLGGKPYHAALFEGIQAGRLLESYLQCLEVPGDVLRRVRRTAYALDEALRGVLDCSRAPRTICCGLLWMAVVREGVAVTKKAVMAACDGVCQQSLDKVVAELESLLPRA